MGYLAKQSFVALMASAALLAGCSTVPDKPVEKSEARSAQPAQLAQPAQPTEDVQEAKAAQSIADGVRLLRSGKPNEAIPIFSQLAADYEIRFNDGNTRYFSARNQVETLLYLATAANEKTGNASVVTPNWAYSYYLTAYALAELGRIPEAKASLDRALKLSPRNSQFLSELGNLYQREKNWQSALQAFQRAESAARETSPEHARNLELSRAWRGIGYVYVEQGRLDDAERIYRQCLELNRNDTAASKELLYVQALRDKQRARQ